MSASHGYSTTGGIENDDRVKYKEDKKVESLTPTWLTNGLGDAHQLISLRGVGIVIQRMH